MSLTCSWDCRERRARRLWMTLVRSRQSMQLLRKIPSCCTSTLPSLSTRKYLPCDTSLSTAITTATGPQHLSILHNIVLVCRRSNLRYKKRKKRIAKQTRTPSPKFILRLGHDVQQDLQAVPPHPTALLVEVKRHVPKKERQEEDVSRRAYQLWGWRAALRQNTWD